VYGPIQEPDHVLRRSPLISYCQTRSGCGRRGSSIPELQVALPQAVRALPLPSHVGSFDPGLLQDMVQARPHGDAVDGRRADLCPEFPGIWLRVWTPVPLPPEGHHTLDYALVRPVDCIRRPRPQLESPPTRTSDSDPSSCRRSFEASELPFISHLRTPLPFSRTKAVASRCPRASS
jgi:hypothetical protein